MLSVVAPGYACIANTLRGPRMFCRNDQVMAFALSNYGEFAEDELTRLADYYLQPGMVALDIGANIGIHATAFAAAVGPSGHVLAFEPQPPIYNFLCANIALASAQNVEAMRCIVSDNDGEATMPSYDLTKSTNFGAINAIKESAAAMTGIAVEVLRIDTLGLKRCDLIKIDVEGEELRVLNGAAKTIEQYRPIIMAECNDIIDAEENAAKLLPWFVERNYATYWLFSRLFRKQNFNRSKDMVDDNDKARDRNILAVPKDKGVPAGLTDGLARCAA